MRSSKSYSGRVAGRTHDVFSMRMLSGLKPPTTAPDHKGGPDHTGGPDLIGGSSAKPSITVNPVQSDSGTVHGGSLMEEGEVMTSGLMLLHCDPVRHGIVIFLDLLGLVRLSRTCRRLYRLCLANSGLWRQHIIWDRGLLGHLKTAERLSVNPPLSHSETWDPEARCWTKRASYITNTGTTVDILVCRLWGRVHLDDLLWLLGSSLVIRQGNNGLVAVNTATACVMAPRYQIWKKPHEEFVKQLIDNYYVLYDRIWQAVLDNGSQADMPEADEGQGTADSRFSPLFHRWRDGGRVIDGSETEAQATDGDGPVDEPWVPERRRAPFSPTSGIPNGSPWPAVRGPPTRELAPAALTPTGPAPNGVADCLLTSVVGPPHIRSVQVLGSQFYRKRGMQISFSPIGYLKLKYLTSCCNFPGRYSRPLVRDAIECLVGCVTNINREKQIYLGADSLGAKLGEDAPSLADFKKVLRGQTPT